jgi:hypothetical protein
VKVFHLGEVPYVWLLDDAASMPRALRMGECLGKLYGPLEDPPRECRRGMPSRAWLVKCVVGLLLIVLAYYFITRVVLVSVILHH